MKSYDKPGRARIDLLNYRNAHEARLGAFVTGKLDDALEQVAPAAVIVDGMEALYAARERLDAEGHGLVASFASFAIFHGFFEYGSGELLRRAQGLIAASRRDAGEVVDGVSWPDPADDPAPLERFVEPAEPGPAPGV